MAESIPGEMCLACQRGRLTVYSTRVVGGFRVRYLRCDACGTRPESNKQTIPLAHAPPRIPLKRLIQKRLF